MYQGFSKYVHVKNIHISYQSMNGGVDGRVVLLNVKDSSHSSESLIQEFLLHLGDRQHRQRMHHPRVFQVMRLGLRRRKESVNPG